MALDDRQKGTLFALSAACLNGSIGILSKMLMAAGIHPSWIAALKTVLGFLLVSFVLLALRRSELQKNKLSLVALAAFFGIFVLFYFETAAYRIASAANVVVILMAMGAVTANLMGWYFLGDRPNQFQWFGLILSVFGISFILHADMHLSILGFGLAMGAGVGYGLFTVLIKKFSLQGGLMLTRQLLFFGGIFLLIPASTQPLNAMHLASPTVVLALFGLAVFPSILGFYCTTKAVDFLPPAKVQLLELSEPVFAAILAFGILREIPTVGTLIGGALTLIGIYMGTLKRPSQLTP